MTEISGYSLTGFVARIVTDDDLIINKGRVDGVAEGMIFDILDTRTRDVTDPDTRRYRPRYRRESWFY